MKSLTKLRPVQVVPYTLPALLSRPAVPLPGRQDIYRDIVGTVWRGVYRVVQQSVQQLARRALWQQRLTRD